MYTATQTSSFSDLQLNSSDRTARNERVRSVAYWATTILGPASFVYGGILNIARSPEAVAGVQHLGYPLYFATILGVWKVLGAITIVAPRLPRLKEWAYAGFFFDLTGAAASRVFVGDGLAEGGGVVAPLVFLALVMASWTLRPASRRLGSSVG